MCAGISNAIIAGQAVSYICCSSHSFIGAGDAGKIGTDGIINCNNATFGGFKPHILVGCFNAIGAGYELTTANNSCFTFQTATSGGYISYSCFSVLGGGFGLASSNNATTVGTIYKTSGTFTINHPNPNKPSHTLSHSFVESPSVGDNLYKYRVTSINCQALITLPDYYKHLNCDDHIHVSPVDNLGTGFGIMNQEQTELSVCTTQDGEYDVILLGTRKDIDAQKRLYAQVGAERIVSKHPYQLIKFN